MAQSLGQDVPHARHAARRLFKKDMGYKLDPRNWPEGLANAFDWYRDAVQFPEMAPRAAEVERRAKELDIDLSRPVTLDEFIELFVAGKQVTTDFTAGGKFVKWINRMVPFVNAGIQGPRANIRAFRRNPQKYALRNLLYLTIPSLFLWWRHKDEEWWKTMDYREKFLHWHFPVPLPSGGTVMVRIPRAFEPGMIFSALPEVALDSWYLDDPESASAWFDLFVQSATPPYRPPLLEEYIEQKENLDRFWDMPLVTRGEEEKYPFEQYNDYTSKFSIWVGKHWPTKKDEFGARPGLSPKRIDHAIRGVFGPMGGDFVGAIGLGSKDINTYWEPSRLPVVGRMFMRNAPYGTRSPYIERVYDALEEAQRFQRSDFMDETHDQRERRLLLDDAAKALTAAGWIRRYSPTQELSTEITQEMLSLAKEAIERLGDEIPISAADRGKFRRFRQQYEREKERQEGKEPTTTARPPGAPRPPTPPRRPRG